MSLTFNKQTSEFNNVIIEQFFKSFKKHSIIMVRLIIITVTNLLQ